MIESNHSTSQITLEIQEAVDLGRRFLYGEFLRGLGVGAWCVVRGDGDPADTRRSHLN